MPSVTAAQRARSQPKNKPAAADVLGDFVHTVSHDINQPLTAILGNAEVAILMIDSPKPPIEELRGIVADIRIEAERASDLIRGIRQLLESAGS